MIGNEEDLGYFELHICVKDYCFARDDRLVGVAVIQIKDIVEQVSYNKHFDMAHFSNPNFKGLNGEVAAAFQANTNGRNWMDNFANPIAAK